MEQAEKRALAEQRSAAGNFFEAATLHSEAGDPASALQCLLRIAPDDSRYRLACQRAVVLATELDALSLEFETFIGGFVRSGPQDAAELQSFYALGKLYQAQGFVENAREAFTKLLAREPAYRDAQALLGSLGQHAAAELPDLPEPPPLPDPSSLVTRARTPRRGPGEPEPAGGVEEGGAEDLDEQSPIFAEGATIADRYRLEQRIGHGGMSVVFRATDLVIGEPIALKVFTQAVYDAETDGRFTRELKLSRQLYHPNIVRLYDIGMYRGFRYISMELLVGMELRGRMSEPLPVEEGVSYMIQACSGLQAAHERGVVHRDVKPENCFITSEGVLKLMDFGIAKLQNAPGLTATGIIAGTPAYMSPEQIRDFSGVTPASDLYSLGVLAYEMFTARVPFMHPELISLFIMHTNDPPVPPRTINPSLPEELERLILKLLAKRPAERFASAGEVVRHLERIRRR
jgi:serine/threonine-protein kinase